MHIFMIFSLLTLTAVTIFVASRLNEPEAQPVKIRSKDQRSNDFSPFSINIFYYVFIRNIETTLSL